MPTLEACFLPLMDIFQWPSKLRTTVVLRDITEVKQEAMDTVYQETMDLDAMIGRHQDPDNPVRYDPEPTFPKVQPDPRYFHSRHTPSRTVFKGGRQKRWSEK